MPKTDALVPAFHPLAEALMASLASRAHEWDIWEIEEKLGAQTEIWVRIFRLKHGSKQALVASALLPKDFKSPSLAVSKLLDAIRKNKAKKTKAYPKKSFQNISTKTQKLAQNPTQNFLSKLKNSKGYFDLKAQP